MHNSSISHMIDDRFGAAWASQWYEHVSNLSPQTADDLLATLQSLTSSLVHLLSAPADFDPISLTRAAKKAFDASTTGLPVEVTQRLGFQSLGEVQRAYQVPAAELPTCWRVIFPWLHHPYFTISTIRGMVEDYHPGSMLSSLIAQLREFPETRAVRVWRYIDAEGPMIEIADGGGRMRALEEDEEFSQAIATREMSLHGDRMVMPMFLVGAPFAIVEVEAPISATSHIFLDVLLLVSAAEYTLSRHHQQEQTSPATWQRVITHFAQALTVSHSEDEIIATLAAQVRQALPCERITFWRYFADTEEYRLCSVSARLTAEAIPVGSRCPAADTPLQVARMTGQPLLLDDGWEERFPNYPNANDSINALAVVPLIFEYRCLGILTIERLEPRPFSRQDADWLKLLAAMLGAALANLEIHEALKQAQARRLEDVKMRALGEMSAGIAHDFNNILMAMMCNLELMNMATDLRQVQDRMPRLEVALTDARNIVQRVSTLSRKDPTDNFTPLSLADILLSTAELLQPQWETNDVEFSTDFAPNTPHVRGNATELREVVTNLITNALFAMPDGGTLHLACGRDGNRAWFLVRDTGYGMSPDVLAKACDPFFSTKKGMGTGLGLSVSHHIIHRHQGTLILESQEGAGTTARVELPAVEEHGEERRT